MRAYPDGQHQFVLGTTTNIFFAAHDRVTCEEISKRAGQATVVDSGGDDDTRQHPDGAGPGSVGTSRTRSRNWSFAGRPLLRPEEGAGLPDRVAITFAPGVGAPLLTWLTRYYEEAEPPPPSRRARVWAAVRTLFFAGSAGRRVRHDGGGRDHRSVRATGPPRRPDGPQWSAGGARRARPTYYPASEGLMARNRVWEFIKKAGRDVDNQVWTRSGPHGAAELGAALFGQSNAYVMYGHAGRPGDARPAADQEERQQQQVEPNRPNPEQHADRGRKGRGR